MRSPTSTMTASAPLQTLAITYSQSDASLEKLRKTFSSILYYPDENVPKEEACKAEVWLTRYTGLPKGLTFEDLGKTQIVQLTSAGANNALAHPALKSREARAQISICNSSGIHVLTIPGYIIGQIIGIISNIHTSIYITRAEGRWPRRHELKYRPDNERAALWAQGHYTIREKTAGMLGYGHIARETARLLQAFGVKVIAANSNGQKRQDDGYIIPGTGDKDGSIPEAYYSTNDPASFKEFLSRTDILIASLPSTPATTYLLQKEHFDALPKDAIFINVGRGDLVKSEILLEALDREDGLLAVGLDVTDPEPLPRDHPLLTHKRAVITPHVSSDFAGYFDACADLLIANVKQMRAGGGPMNRVDPDKGY